MTDDSKPADPPAKIDPAKTKPGRQWKHASPLLAGRFDPAGRYLFVTAQDQTVQRIDPAGEKLTPLAGHDSWVRTLAFAPRERLVISGGYDGRLIWWPADADAPTPLRSVAAHDGWVRAVAVSPDGTTLASAGNDGRVKLWSAAEARSLGELRGHDCHVYNLAFHPSGAALVSADLKGMVRVWDVAKRALTRTLDAKALYRYDTSFRADIGGARAIAFNHDGKLLALGGITDVTNAFAGVGKPAVVLLDWESGKLQHLLRPAEEFQGLVSGLTFHPDGMLIGTGAGTGGALWFWKADQEKSVFTLKLPTNARDLSLHPTGARLAIPFFDGVARLYDLTA